MGKNFEEKESKPCPDKEKGISGNNGKRQASYLVGALWLFNSHSWLHSGSLSSRAELGKEKGVRKHQALLAAQVNLPPTTYGSRSDKVTAFLLNTGKTRLSQQDHCISQTESVPGLTKVSWEQSAGVTKAQRRPYLLCYMDSHTNSHPGDTGTLNLNTISRTRSHKHTDHADKHCHNCRVTSTPHTHIPSATHHGNTVTTKSHAPYNITNTHTTETQSQIPQ